MQQCVKYLAKKLSESETVWLKKFEMKFGNYRIYNDIRNKSMKGIYFFCCDPNKDPVASGIFNQVINMYNLQETTHIFDNQPVLKYVDLKGNEFLFAKTEEVLSHNYIKYLSQLEQLNDKYDFAGIVNWHEGKNAPNQILTVHTNSDVASGNFSTANPWLNRNIIQAIENNRLLAGLKEFSTKTEATHWSGVTYQQPAELIPQFTVPLVDIEIGSLPDSWSHPIAAEIIATSLTQVFDKIDQEEVMPILYIGGEHFDQDLTNIAINVNFPFAFCHHLPNQWFKDYAANQEVGFKYLTKCKDSIIGDLRAIFYHDGMSGPLKTMVKTFAEQHNIPVFKHKALRDPDKLLKELLSRSVSGSRPRPRV